MLRGRRMLVIARPLRPPYVIDTVVLVLGAALAFVVALIGFYLMPEIADLMPPALNGPP
jgi:hypothetical protein